jgi:uncharacterized membrane protein
MSMRCKQLSQAVEKYLDGLVKLVGYITAVALVLSYVSKFFTWGNSGPFAYIRDHIQVLWLVALTVVVLILWIWSGRLRQQLVSGFSDNFKGDLHANWDFEGPWRIPEKGMLLVTGSNAGGITKVGALWENYTFTFKARIIEDCLGVIVRAQDLNNYYMLQIRTDQIRPHRRATVAMVEMGTSSEGEGVSQPRAIKFTTGWQIFDPPTHLARRLDDWFDVKVTVRGQSVFLYIDDELAFHKDSFLQIPTGKVGFRNMGSEQAHVKDVRVVLLS